MNTNREKNNPCVDLECRLVAYGENFLGAGPLSDWLCGWFPKFLETNNFSVPDSVSFFQLKKTSQQLL